jgi:putative phosphotransacetylase
MLIHGISQEQLNAIVQQAVLKSIRDHVMVVSTGVSNKHIHLTRRDLDVLFGYGYELTVKKHLSQPGQYAAEECVEVIGPKGSFPKVRILGPLRKHTQIELARTDCFKVGVKAPVRSSGDLKGTPGIILRGPAGTLQVKEGVIVADRHIHLSAREADQFGLYNGDHVNVIIGGEKPGIMENVLIRAGDGNAMDFHIDTDDANAFGLHNGSLVTAIKVTR